MRRISLSVPDKKYQFFMELVKHLEFVKVEEEVTNQEILKGIEQGLKEVKLIQDGKLPKQSAQDFLNEL